jgi:hypothetical protein
MNTRPRPLYLGFISVFVGLSAAACGDDSPSSASDAMPVDAQTDAEAPIQVGYEILQTVSPSEIVVWISSNIEQAEFDAIELPAGWFKNQPREGEADGGSFARSPDALEDGPLTEATHFGHSWQHNATVIEANTPVDENGLLRLSKVAKFHTVTFNAGRTLSVLVSPDDEAYIRISRDANRTSEAPTLPEGWRIDEVQNQEELVIELPNPTMNIRGDNEDSFQGPVSDF